MENLPMQNQSQLVSIEDYAMSIAGVLKQVELVQKVMKDVMKIDEHYGQIPGTKKPTLYKSGAEKLCMVFRLSQSYEFIQVVREMTFIAYTVRCSLIHIPTGQVVSTGIGSCNSREKKYRYTDREELTETPVPKEYWDARKSNDSKAMKRILGDGMKAIKKDAGQWVLAKFEKIENDNAFDLDNTITKMACKRALVAATLNATAASDIFAQDLEDITVKRDAADAEETEVRQTLKEKLQAMKPAKAPGNPLFETHEWKEWLDVKQSFPDEANDIISKHGEPKQADHCLAAINLVKGLVDAKNA